MMGAALAWAKAHPKLLGAAAALLLVSHAGAFYAGQRSVAQPAVELHQEQDKVRASNSDRERHDVTGPLDATITVGNSPCAAATRRPARTLPEALAQLPAGSIVTFHQGTSTEDSRATTQTVSSESLRTDLRVAPANLLPKFSLGVGLEDPLGAQSPHFEVGARVLTIPFLEKPVWLRVGSTPARGILHGMTIGAEVQL